MEHYNDDLLGILNSGSPQPSIQKNETGKAAVDETFRYQFCLYNLYNIEIHIFIQKVIYFHSHTKCSHRNHQILLDIEKNSSSLTFRIFSSKLPILEGNFQKINRELRLSVYYQKEVGGKALL